MKQRWSISVNAGVSWSDVNPVNGDKHRIAYERDLEAGQIFFRQKLTSPLVFKGADYTTIQAFETNPAERCTSILIKLELKCDAGWTEYWRGKFSAGSGTWDLGACVFEVKPETVDKYTCLLEQSKVKRNILQAPKVDASAVNSPSIEWAACVFRVINVIGPVYASSCSDGIVHTNPSAPPTNWWTASSYPIDPPVDTLMIYWRERVATECVGGSPVPPPGVGWTLLTNDCATTGTAVYIRQPTISFTFVTEEGTCDGGDAVPPATVCDGEWIELTPCGLVVDGDTFPPYFLCYDPTPTDLGQARTLESAVEYILTDSECELGGVRSDFFEWDPVGDAPGYAIGVNYVTGLASQTNALVIYQKSDVIDPNSSNPATIGELTFLELMNILRVMFRCYWDIDDDGFLRVEHWSYWTFQQGIDIAIIPKTNEPLIYKHLGDEIPRLERATFMEAQGRDFVGKDIVYSGPCVTDDEVKEWSPGKVSTDVSYILNDPTAISKDGFVVMACVLDGSNYAAILAAGAITGNIATNAPLAWANLQRDFWTYDRYLPTGNMNGADVTFDGYLPNIEQNEVRVTQCCEITTFDAKETIVSSLGELLGTDAIVESAVYDIPAKRLALTLRYAY